MINYKGVEIGRLKWFQFPDNPFDDTAMRIRQVG